MKKLLMTFGVMAGLGISSAAEAKPVTITTTLASYGGEGAYVVIYLTDQQGKLHSTLHVGAPKAKYHKHLSHWSRGPASARRTVDGITGASVGSGRTLKVSIDLADALIDAGYQIRVDTAVEKGRDNPSEIIVPLARAGAKSPIAGKGYVKSFQFDM